MFEATGALGTTVLQRHVTLPVVPLSLESVFDDAMRAPTVDDYGDVRLLRGGVRHAGPGPGSWRRGTRPRRPGACESKRVGRPAPSLVGTTRQRDALGDDSPRRDADTSASPVFCRPDGWD